MFEEIKRIKEFVRNRTQPGHLPYQLQDVRDAVTSITNVDRIEIYEIPVDRESHFQGRYMRYERRPSPYAELETVVEVEYASRLNYCWSRYVICKEMCQALLFDPVFAADSEDKMNQLCEELRLPPEQQGDLAFSGRLASEKMAQFGAWEILCPLEDRKEIIERRSQGQEISDLTIAQAFRVPRYIVYPLFEESYVAVATRIFESTEGNGN